MERAREIRGEETKSEDSFGRGVNGGALLLLEEGGESITQL